MDSGVLGLTEARVKILRELEKAPKKTKNLFWATGLTWHNCKYHLIKLERLGMVKRTKVKQGKLQASVWEVTPQGKKALEGY